MLVLGQGEHGFEEGLLRQVSGKFPVTGTAQDEAEDVAEVALIEHSESARVCLSPLHLVLFASVMPHECDEEMRQMIVRNAPPSVGDPKALIAMSPLLAGNLSAGEPVGGRTLMKWPLLLHLP